MSKQQATGSIEKVSPVICMHEKILLPIADRLVEKQLTIKSVNLIKFSLKNSSICP